MWPEAVERIASFLREAKTQGQIEELPPGVDKPPGQGVQAAAFECDGRALVALLPEDRVIDRGRLARRGGCTDLRPTATRAFPFEGARVLGDRSLLLHPTVWLEAGSSRHVLGLAPDQLLRLTRAETGTFLVED
jgi:prolyl-tRNA editing enzyme YbaK/EbsC (Cys-tRNA(Pro) deacylase)